MSDLKSTDKPLFELATSAIQENPISAALIGMGLVWLFTGGRAPIQSAVTTAGDVARNVSQSISGVTEASSRGLGRTVDAVSRTASGAASRIVSSAREAAPASMRLDSELFPTAYLKELLQRQPLLIGALGLGIGAALASSVRTTAKEAELFGETSAALQGKARDFAVESAKRASTVVEGIATTVEEEARAQGLTPDALARSAGEGLRRVQGVLQQGVDSAKGKIMGKPDETSGQQPEALATFGAAARNKGKKPENQGLTATAETSPKPGNLADEEKDAGDILGGNAMGDKARVDAAIAHHAKTDKRAG